MLAFISSLNRNSYSFYIVEIVFHDGLGNYVNFDDELYTKYFDEDSGKIYLAPEETLYIVVQGQWSHQYSQNGVYYEFKQSGILNWEQSTD